MKPRKPGIGCRLYQKKAREWHNKVNITLQKMRKKPKDPASSRFRDLSTKGAVVAQRSLLQKGFTLIELLLVISIIGILAAVVLVSLGSARDKSKVARAAVDLRQINTALMLYFDHNGVYPCFDHAWTDHKEIAWAEPYINWPKNPWGYQYHWEHGIISTYSISLKFPGQQNAQNLDKLLDDNNLATGMLRGDGVRIEYMGMDQSVPFIHCHI
jgi:type II secretion system protein G